METTSSNDKLLRLKIASEMVLGNQAAVAFSRAFYLEDMMIERIFSECQELVQNCQALLERVQKFTEEAFNDSSSSNLTPLSESSARCQCSEILESLGTVHQPTLESFQQKLIQAKARRQARSCLLEKLSAQSSDISSQFNSMTLAELINNIHIPEFSCFINDSDFGVLEKIVDEWDLYRKDAKLDFASFEKKVSGFQEDIERNKKMREYRYDMILSQITQQEQMGAYGTDTLKKKGVFHKFSTLLRRQSHKHHDKHSVSVSLSKDVSPTPSQLSVATTSPTNSAFQQTF